jgi:hypothetical protein
MSQPIADKPHPALFGDASIVSRYDQRPYQNTWIQTLTTITTTTTTTTTIPSFLMNPP